MAPFRSFILISVASIIASSLAMTPQMVDQVLNSGEQLARERFAAMKSKWKPISASCNSSLGWLASSNNTEILKYYADAIGKPAAGIKIGAISWLGSYGECTSIPGAHYCLANIGTKYLPPEFAVPGLPPPAIKWGVCVPVGCSDSDIANGIDDILKALNVTDKIYLVPDGSTAMFGDMKSVHCASPSKYTTSVIVTLATFGVLGFLCLVATAIEIVLDYNANPIEKSKNRTVNMCQGNAVTNGLDIKHDTRVNDDKERIIASDKNVSSDGPTVAFKPIRKNNVITEFFLCFSLIRNTSRIMDTKVPASAITSIIGMRVLSMFWVMLGHTFMMKLMLNISNLGVSYEIIQRFSFQVLLNATVSVDSFFFLSGLLVAYLSFRNMEKNNGTLNLFLFYFHRFWRLTPSYMLLLLFYTKLTGFLGEGPMWYPNQDNSPCDKYWWTNLLYINNFYPKDMEKACMGLTWYLANDMQFYIISPVILFLAFRFGKRGLVVTVCSLLSASFLATALIIDFYDYNTASLYGETDVKGAPEFTSAVYVKPYCRIAPYLVGMVLGYILHYLKRPAQSHSNWFLAVGWCLALFFALAPIYGTYGVYKKDNPKPFSHAEKVMYGTFMRFSWSLGLAWVVYVCHIGKGGLVDKILSARFWIPLSRLTYMAYLMHLIVLTVYYGSFQTASFYSDMSVSWDFLATVTSSYLLAYIASVTLEIPMMQLEKILFTTDRKKD